MTNQSLNLITKISAPLIAVYFISMFVAPWFMGGFDWQYVQFIWDRWQSLNVGILAFSSSLIFFQVTKYKESEEKSRAFIAERAFLPSALSELSMYCKKSAEYLQFALSTKKQMNNNTKLSEYGFNSSHPPELPLSINVVFKNCINCSPSLIGEHLANILRLLQIHQSRMESLKEEMQPKSIYSVTEFGLLGLLCSLTEIQALINNTFEFSRGKSHAVKTKLTEDNWIDAFHNLKININDPKLYDFFQKRIGKK